MVYNKLCKDSNKSCCRNRFWSSLRTLPDYWLMFLTDNLSDKYNYTYIRSHLRFPLLHMYRMLSYMSDNAPYNKFQMSYHKGISEFYVAFAPPDKYWYILLLGMLSGYLIGMIYIFRRNFHPLRNKAWYKSPNPDDKYTFQKSGYHKDRSWSE